MIEQRQGSMKKIDSFKGEYAWLSNMAKLSVPITYQGAEYWSNECFYVAMKTKDQSIRKVVSLKNSFDAKKFGRAIALRDDWDAVKDKVMLYGLRAKFSNEPFKSKLLGTGDAYLEEGNWWGDTYWGVCKGVGENKLGILLMQVRDELNNNQRLD